MLWAGFFCNTRKLHSTHVTVQWRQLLTDKRNDASSGFRVIFKLFTVKPGEDEQYSKVQIIVQRIDSG